MISYSVVEIGTGILHMVTVNYEKAVDLAKTFELGRVTHWKDDKAIKKDRLYSKFPKEETSHQTRGG